MMGKDDKLILPDPKGAMINERCLIRNVLALSAARVDNNPPMGRHAHVG